MTINVDELESDGDVKMFRLDLVTVTNQPTLSGRIHPDVTSTETTSFVGFEYRPYQSDTIEEHATALLKSFKELPNGIHNTIK